MTENRLNGVLALSEGPLNGLSIQGAHEINRRVRNVERRLRGDDGGSDDGGVVESGEGDGGGFWELAYFFLSLLGEGNDS